MLHDKPSYLRDREAIADTFTPDETARRYETLFKRLLGKSSPSQDEMGAYAKLHELKPPVINDDD